MWFSVHPHTSFLQEPLWNCEMEFLVPEANFDTVTFKVFDSDRIGKDKSLGR